MSSVARSKDQRPRALEDPVDVADTGANMLRIVDTVGNQIAALGELPRGIHRWQPVHRRELYDARQVLEAQAAKGCQSSELSLPACPLTTKSRGILKCGASTGFDASRSFNHLIGPQQRRRDGDAKRVGGLEIDHQLERRVSGEEPYVGRVPPRHRRPGAARP